jgi:hypothetical protein
MSKEFQYRDFKDFEESLKLQILTYTKEVVLVKCKITDLYLIYKYTKTDSAIKFKIVISPDELSVIITQLDYYRKKNKK